MELSKILITGGSGLVGREITRLLEEKGKEVAWLSRTPERQTQRAFFWDVKNQEIDQNALSWCNAIIHLAGEGVAEKRWSEERKRQILESRVHSTRLLYNTLSSMSHQVHTFVGASAIGYYGLDTGNELQSESQPPGNDFLAGVVKSWETESEKIATLGIRTVLLRVGIVLAKEGGALQEMLKPPVAAPLGDGEQYMSWIHLKDLARMFVFALSQSQLQGTFNAVGPVPVSNRILTKAAAKATGKPFVPIGVPGFLLKVALGEMAQMVLGGNRVSNDKIAGTGFSYLFPELRGALGNLYG